MEQTKYEKKIILKSDIFEIFNFRKEESLETELETVKKALSFLQAKLISKNEYVSAYPIQISDFIII